MAAGHSASGVAKEPVFLVAEAHVEAIATATDHHGHYRTRSTFSARPVRHPVCTAVDEAVKAATQYVTEYAP